MSKEWRIVPQTMTAGRTCECGHDSGLHRSATWNGCMSPGCRCSFLKEAK